jgi:hypothetical protein
VTATNKTTSTVEANNKLTCPDNLGTRAAIGLGVGLPLALALTGALFLLFRERRQREMYEMKVGQASGQIAAESSVGQPVNAAPVQQIYEAPVTQRLHEVSTER